MAQQTGTVSMMSLKGKEGRALNRSRIPAKDHLKGRCGGRGKGTIWEKGVDYLFHAGINKEEIEGQ